MTRKLFAVASVCVLVGAMFAATPALAGGEPGTMKVLIGDLNVRSDNGAQSALSRIKHASSVFCEDKYATRDLARETVARKCRDRMMYLAVSQLDAPLVTARYQASGAKPPILLATR